MAFTGTSRVPPRGKRLDLAKGDVYIEVGFCDTKTRDSVFGYVSRDMPENISICDRFPRFLDRELEMMGRYAFFLRKEKNLLNRLLIAPHVVNLLQVLLDLSGFDNKVVADTVSETVAESIFEHL